MKQQTLMKRLQSIAFSLATLLAIALPQQSVSAADVYWGGGTGAITDDNWYSDAGLTTPATLAASNTINLAGGTLFVVNTATINSTNIGLAAGDNAAVIVSGTWNNTTGNLSIGDAAGSAGSLSVLGSGSVRASTFYVGSYGSGTFYLAEGAMLTNSANAFLGRNAASAPTHNLATIDGIWNIGGNFNIGNALNHTGEVIVNGVINATNTSGQMRIGNGQSDSVGDAASVGILRITETGTVIFSGTEIGVGHLGMASSTNAVSNSSGTAIVNGVLLDSGNLKVGRSGHGHLEIGQSGTVIVGTFSIIGDGNSSYNVNNTAVGPVGGTAIVDGYFGVGTYLYVGNNSPGSLEIGQTGTVKIGNHLYIGNAAIGSGTVTVAGLLDVATNIRIGSSGTGTLEILSGGTVIQRGANNYVASAVSGASSNGDVIIRSGGYLDTGARAHAAQANFGIGWSGQGALLIETGGTAVAAATTSDNVAFSLGYTGHGTGTIAGTLVAATGYSDIGQSGTGSLAIESGGLFIADRVRLASANVNAKGTLILNGGVLETRQIARGLGTATMLFNGGTIRATASTDDFFSNIPVVDLGAGSLTLDTQAFAVTATNALAGSSGATLNKIGAGTLVLTADSSAYAGTINIRSGILASGNSSAKLGGNVTIFDGVMLDLRNDALATTGNLTFNDGAVWIYSFETQQQLIANNLTIAGDGTFFLDLGNYGVGDLMPGTYTLGSYTTGIGINNLENWTINGGTVAYNATIDTSDGSSIKLNFNSAGVNFLDWQGGDGDWNASSASWKISGTAVKWGYGGLGVFDSGSGTVNVTGLHTFDALQFNVNGYTLAGTGTLAGNTLAGNGALNFNVTVASATATINTALAGTNLNKVGPGALILGSNVAPTGTTVIRGGTLEIAGAGALNADIVEIAPDAADTATLRVAGVLTNTGILNIGKEGSGALVVANGGVVNQAVETYIGRAGSGLLLVENGGAFYQTGSYFRVGGGAVGDTTTSGTLIIQNGGTVDITNNIHIGAYGSGTALIDGYLRGGASSYVGVYAGSQGVATIGQTGTFSGAGLLTIGYNATSSGTLIVKGLAKVGTNLYVGYNANATGNLLDIKNTGTVTVGSSGHIGNAVGSSGTVSVAGRFENIGNLYVGNNGTGYLDIATTGTVKTGGIGFIGNAAGSSGTATVSGLWGITGNLAIGNNGAGTLDLQSGGTVIVGGTTIIGYNATTGSGTLALNGGVLQTTQLARGAGASTLIINGGTLRAAASTDDFFVNFADLNLNDGTLAFDTNGFTITATNALAGTIDGKFVKTGSGSLALTADSTAFTGTIAVQKGALVLAADPNTSVGAKLNQVYVENGGSIRSSAADATINTLAIASGGALDMREAALTINDSVTFADGAIWRYSLTGTHALSVASSGTLIFDGDGTFILDRDGLNIDSTIGLYTIANYYAISGTDNLLGWDIAGGDFSVDDYNIQFDLGSTPNAIKIFIGDASVDRLLWQGGNGDWDTTSTTWKRGNASDVWSDGAFAIFDTGTGIVNVTGLHTVYALQFGDITSVDYTLNGTGTLTSLSAAEIKVVSATDIATINTAIKTPGFNKSGLGTLVLGGNATFDGAALVKNGALEVSTTGTMTATEVLIEGAAPTVRVAGVLTNSGLLQIGGTLNGALVVANGGVVNQRSHTAVGSSADGAGLLHVETGGLFKQTSGYFRIGGGAAGETATSGTLIVETGGTASSAGHIHIGAYGSGTALIDGTLTGNGNTYIGVYSGAQGEATIGNDGVLDTTGYLTIGYDATGTLTVAGLAKAGSHLYLGQNAGSTGNLLDITSSGTVAIGDNGLIGNAVGSSGTVNVAGLLNFDGNLAVGMSGAGYLNIIGGGEVNNAAAGIAWNADSTGHADVAGHWNVRNDLRVGYGADSTGVLDIKDTGTVTVGGTGFIGYAAGSSGTVNVAGHYNIATSPLYIGNSGNGTLEILNGGTVSAGAGNNIGYDAGVTGHLIIRNGGLWQSTRGISVGYSGTGNIQVGQGGSLILDDQCLYIANQVGSSGSVTIDGYYESGGGGTYYQPVGYRGVGTFDIGATGTVRSGAFELGREAGAEGNSTVAGLWLISGVNNNVIGKNEGSIGNLVIENTGTILVSTTHVGNYFVVGLNENSSGTAIIRGHLDTGIRSNSATDGNLIIGHSGTGYMLIEAGGVVIASATGGDTAALSMGRNTTGNGTLDIAGLLSLKNGNAIVGNAGTAVLNIASTGTVVVGGQYRQGMNSVLSVAASASRSTAYITAESASLSGTLALDGASFSYAPVAKASELSDLGILILHATSGTIGGGFTTVTGVNGSALPDYLSIGGQAKANNDGSASYYAGYRLAWNSLTGAHGTFTLEAGQTFEVDTPLTDRVGETDPAWDKKSLTKKGAGTLILSGQNTFSGTLNIVSGTIRLSGTAMHNYSALANNGVFDFGPQVAPDIYRTATVKGLSGNGTIRMSADPGTGVSDRLIVNGNAEGTHRFIIRAADGATAPTIESPATVVATISGRNTATFTGGLDFEGTNYAAVQTAPGTISLVANGAAGVYNPIAGVPGSQSLMWFASQDNLSRRLGEMRMPENTPAGNYSVWLRARAESSRLNASTNMRPFDMDLYGFEFGADKTFAIPSARLAVGVYFGYGHATQDFDPRAGTGTADGTSDQLSLGAYAAWLNDTGWFANATLAGARFDNDFSSADQSGNRTKGDYNDNAIGLSFEFGKRIALGENPEAGWFAESLAQVSYVRLMRDDYHTKGANNLNVDGSDMTISRLRATLRIGRGWKLNTGRMEIAGRAGAAGERSTGGKIRVGDSTPWRPNVDGSRVEAGAGLIWRPTVAGQLYFDYEFATGSGYQKPWSISLGYRHAF
ncbi:autotransporter outer membrane beta-barrel domain-containing protein [Ereboglobus luteus]|uniref:Autotransporter domain-containing protein n=1 Tax=Ereboglobus luteus TaxID=1796921 RepID=A0A2U8E434_9BACT|nr:autotransporter outer membrane beta-barrel domain-containing protein [Ereboglobus luteus]AWI09669.1 hypothetical protein CKA38_10775 [Ereboglobus luteus]